jgi:muconolactone delta-isomerase
MNPYMVIIKLPNELTEEFVLLIPKQRAHIDKLMDEGKILQYSLAADRSFLWVTIVAESEQAVMDVLSTFPLIGYMSPIITELAFHNSVSNELPKLIMN